MRCVSVENFKQLDKCDVWSHLQAGKNVYAVILKSEVWRTGIKELWQGGCTVRNVNELLSDEENDILFFEEIEV